MTPFSFETYFATLIAFLQATFPTVPTVAEYPRLRKKIEAPAILVELADLTHLDDAGTEQLCLAARFEARIVFDQVPIASSNQNLAALSLAASTALAIYRQGRIVAGGAGPAKNFKLEPDQFKPDLAGYAVWLVEWVHDLRLGASVWDGEGIRPSTIYVGYAPEIGAGNEGRYDEVAP